MSIADVDAQLRSPRLPEQPVYVVFGGLGGIGGLRGMGGFSPILSAFGTPEAPGLPLSKVACALIVTASPSSFERRSKSTPKSFARRDASSPRSSQPASLRPPEGPPIRAKRSARLTWEAPPAPGLPLLLARVLSRFLCEAARNLSS